jgi:hypothetical protein
MSYDIASEIVPSPAIYRESQRLRSPGAPLRIVAPFRAPRARAQNGTGVPLSEARPQAARLSPRR